VPHDAAIDPDRIALGIQQPWAELILRGVKTLEIRSQPTRQQGTIYLYASKRPSPLDAAATAARQHEIDVALLPFGVLVGTVNLVDCRLCTAKDQKAACVPAALLKGHYAWQLTEPRRLAEPVAVRFLPYGIWFYPFKRRPDGRTHKES
jgi:ASCH domain-containing protein